MTVRSFAYELHKTSGEPNMGDTSNRETIGIQRCFIFVRSICLDVLLPIAKRFPFRIDKTRMVSYLRSEFPQKLQVPFCIHSMFYARAKLLVESNHDKGRRMPPAWGAESQQWPELRIASMSVATVGSTAVDQSHSLVE